MNFFKRFLVIILIYIFSNQFCHMEVDAFFTNTHFNFGKAIIEQSGVSLSKDEENAFLSGLIYADIGRFEFDKKTSVHSDSYEFIKEMKKHTETPEERWFVRGFEMHVLQDKETGKFLKEIFGREKYSHLEYIVDCSLLDNYFFKKTGCYISNDFLHKFNFKQISQGIDIEKLNKLFSISENKIENYINTSLTRYSNVSNKCQLVICANLIRDTYSFFDFKITLDDIYEQAANILVVSIVTANIAEKNEISTDLAHKIKVKNDELVKLCVSKLKPDIVSK